MSHPTIQLFSDVAHRSRREGEKHSLREFSRRSAAERVLARMTWSDTHSGSALAIWVANRQT